MSANEIKNIKNLGKKSLDEIGECLNKLGYGDDFELPENLRSRLLFKKDWSQFKKLGLPGFKGGTGLEDP